MKNSFLAAIIFSMMMLSINAFALDADEDLLYDQGVEHYNNGNYIQALKDFEAVLRANPNNSEAKEFREKIRKERGYDTPQAAPAQTTPYATYYQTPTYSSSSSSEEEVKTRFGLRFAIPIMSVDFDNGYSEAGFGLNGLSFVLSIPLLSRVTIEPEIDVLNYRFFWNGSDSDVDYKYEEYAISVPLTLRFVTSPPPSFGLYAEAGAQLDFAISTNYTEFEGEQIDDEPVEDRTFFGYGLVFGGGFQFNMGDMVVLLGYRYVNSLTDFFTFEGEGYGKLTQHQISLGLLF